MSATADRPDQDRTCADVADKLAFVIESDHLRGRAIRRGDTLIFDGALTPAEGDIVAVRYTRCYDRGRLVELSEPEEYAGVYNRTPSGNLVVLSDVDEEGEQIALVAPVAAATILGVLVTAYRARPLRGARVT